MLSQDIVFKALVAQRPSPFNILSPTILSGDFTVEIPIVATGQINIFSGSDSSIFSSAKNAALDIAGIATGVGTVVSVVKGVIDLFGFTGSDNEAQVLEKLSKIDSRLDLIDAHIQRISLSIELIDWKLEQISNQIDSTDTRNKALALKSRCNAIALYLRDWASRIRRGENLRIALEAQHLDLATARILCTEYPGYELAPTVAAAMNVEMALLKLLGSEEIMNTVRQQYLDYFERALDETNPSSLAGALNELLTRKAEVLQANRTGSERVLFSETIQWVAEDDHDRRKKRLISLRQVGTGSTASLVRDEPVAEYVAGREVCRFGGGGGRGEGPADRCHTVYDGVFYSNHALGIRDFESKVAHLRAQFDNDVAFLQRADSRIPDLAKAVLTVMAAMSMSAGSKWWESDL